MSRNLAAVPHPATNSDRLLTVEEKALELHISVSHLRRLVAAGVVQALDLSIPGTKRRVLRFRRDA